ncbi:MAG: tyrosine-protein phosphatase [Pseudomonadota bacterium]
MIRDTETSPFLPTEGIHNLRDYGGWQVPGEGRVKTGLLWRSGQHMQASDADLDAFQALGVRTIIDLRGLTERSKFPCRRHARFDADVLSFEGETSSSPPHMGDGETVTMTTQRAYDRMIAVYTRMPVNPAMIAMFTRYFEALDTRGGASLVHCFAGKDRTGIAASLLLHVLGVPREDVIAEFLRTNEAPTKHILERQSLPRMREVYDGIEEGAVLNLMNVRREYIETFFQVVERERGSLDTYLAQTLGVDEARKARLKAKLVT